jgi:hypothetical protein
VNHRTEYQRFTGTTQVLTFRLEQYDDRGNRLPPVPVEMRGRSIHGVLNDGDVVAVPARRRPDGVLRARRIANVTHGGALVTARRQLCGCRIAAAIPVLLLVLIVMGMVMGLFFEQGGPALKRRPSVPGLLRR